MAKKPTPAAAKTTTNLVDANLFELRRGTVTITYTVSDFAGQPQVNLQDASGSRTFQGDEVHLETTALGTLVTVTLAVIPDLRTDLLTLVIPQVLVNPGRSQRFRSPVIFHSIASSIAGLPLVPGPVQTYQTSTFSGRASFVLS